MTKPQETAHHLAHLKDAAAEIIRDPHGFAAFIEEIGNGLSHDERRSFCLIVSANCHEIGLEMLKILGETAKMVHKDFRRPSLDGFVDTKRPVKESE